MRPDRENPAVWRDGLFFQSRTLNSQLIRCLDAGSGGGATVTECLMTAAQVENETERGWYEAWHRTAERVRGVAEESLRRGHTMSARQAFLRASMYYRSAEFFMHAPHNLPLGLDAAARMRECFLKAAPFLPCAVTQVSLAYESTDLPCYFYAPSSVAKRARAPVVIVSMGLDDTAEEMHFKLAMPAVTRGYAVLVVQGPGQGQVIREQGLPFRPDWETVITPAVDYLVGRGDVDATSIVVYGNSFSGGLVMRAAAFEHRPRIYVANSGILSFADWVRSSLPAPMTALLERSPEEFDERMRLAAAESFESRAQEDDLAFKFGTLSPSERFRSIGSYTSKDVVQRITSHVLVVDSEDEMFPGQAKQLYEALSGSKSWVSFTRGDMASLHCQAGNRELSNQRIFDWLDEFLVRT